jgi:D-alanyl-D-alanine carboxypeptidase/D-alanyl-D-alanine-endopeptidase (penicillin-binding protein 4)
MNLARPSKTRSIKFLLALTLVISLALSLPFFGDTANAKGRSRAAQKSKSKSKSKAHSSRSKSKRKSVASRSRRGRGKHARGRKGRWRSRYARSKPSLNNNTGIHNYLTQAWSNPQPQTAKEPGTHITDSDLASSNPAPAPPPDTTVGTEKMPAAVPPASSASAEAEGDPDVVIPTNPLVAAFADSLALRRLSYENQGFIVTTMNGEVLGENNADGKFNPASVIKVATSLTAISKLGPDFRFRTILYTDGNLDTSTGTLHGSLYVIGSGDPAFLHENALLIVDKLNRAGIRSIEGDLIVLGQFYFNFSANRDTSAKAFRQAITAEKWTPALKIAYPRFLAMRHAEEGRPYTATYMPDQPPSLKITGKTISDPSVDTTRIHQLAVHTSLPLVRVLKGLNDFSNNWMAHVIGSLVGGSGAVERFLESEVGLSGEELNIATTSGLGANYISPRATIQILRKLVRYLNSKGLAVEDLLPVAGIDAGTLQRRFTDAYRGSVVAKTGTLSSVSALAGVAYTRGKGPLLFVIYNRGGSVNSFRAAQDETIKKIITLYGGPAPVGYSQSGAPGVSSTQTPSSSK